MATAIGVIPARWSSTRFPGKSLTLIAGKPMIQWVVERARQAKALERVVVATDDERIASVIHALERPNIDVVMTRADHPSGTDRVAEVAAAYDSEAVVNIQGDEPLIEPKLIDRLVAALFSGGWEMATAVTAIAGIEEVRDPSVVKAVFNQFSQALFFSRAAIPCIRPPEAGLPLGAYWRHIGIYAYRYDGLARLTAAPPCTLEQFEKLEQLRALDMGLRMKVIKTGYCGPGVDTPADVAKAERHIFEMNEA